MPKSRFIFKAHKHSADEHRTSGLVHVYDRETEEFIGMVNPTAEDGYILRDTTGERLSVHYSGRFDDNVYTSRDTAAAILVQRVAAIGRVKARRAVSVSAGCANDWHNGSEYKETHPCPECPSRIGLQLALSRVQSLISVREEGGDEAGPLTDIASEIEDLIYKAES